MCVAGTLSPKYKLSRSLLKEVIPCWDKDMRGLLFLEERMTPLLLLECTSCVYV